MFVLLHHCLTTWQRAVEVQVESSGANTSLPLPLMVVSQYFSVTVKTRMFSVAAQNEAALSVTPPAHSHFPHRARPRDTRAAGPPR